jgi:chemotaxis protein CheD
MNPQTQPHSGVLVAFATMATLPHKLGGRPLNQRSHRQQRIGIGEVAASAQPLLLRTLLGSCVSVCLRDPVLGIGGMNHILVPGKDSQGGLESRCGVQAMELLINELMKLGADRRRMVAKAFGGGNVLPGFQTPTVGEQNARFVREFLNTEKIPLIAERMGGSKAVLVNFHTHSGKVSIHTVDGSRLPKIVRDETDYLRTPLADRFNVDEPTIF